MYAERILRRGLEIYGIEGERRRGDGDRRRAPHERRLRVSNYRLVPGDVERIHISAAEKRCCNGKHLSGHDLGLRDGDGLRKEAALIIRCRGVLDLRLGRKRIDKPEIEIELGTDGDDEWAQAAQRGLVEILEEGIEIVAHVGGIGIERGRIHKAYDPSRYLVAEVGIGVGRNEGADALNGEIESSADGCNGRFRRDGSATGRCGCAFRRKLGCELRVSASSSVRWSGK